MDNREILKKVFEMYEHINSAKTICRDLEGDKEIQQDILNIKKMMEQTIYNLSNLYDKVAEK